MGKINIAGWGLWFGAIGQALLLYDLIGRAPYWFTYVALLGPWLLVFVISFCRVAPCGPARFAQILTLAMAWYSLDTLVCELVWLFVAKDKSHLYVAALAHALCYGSAATFTVLIRAVRDARNYQSNHPASG